MLVTVAFRFWMHTIDRTYLIEAFTEGQIPDGVTLQTIADAGSEEHKVNVIYVVLTWTALFAVKYSFLFFFQPLVSRIRPLTIWWRGVLVFTTLAWLGGYAACAIVTCPYFGEDSCKQTLAKK